MSPFIAAAAGTVNRISTRLGDWWRRRASIRRARLELDNDPQEIARLAREIGLSSRDLRALAGHPRDASELLARRMAVLKLDPADLARRDGAVMQDLQRLCTLCESKGRCAAELDWRPKDPAWKDYCPNSGTLTGLQERWPGRPAGTKGDPGAQA